MPKAMAAPMTAASARPVGREGRVGVHKVALQCRERRVRVWKNAQHAFSALGSRLLLDRRAYRGAVVHHIAHGARAATGGAAVGTPRKCFSPNGSAPRAAAAVPHGTQPAESQGEDWPETPPPPGVSSVRRSRRREGIFARPLSKPCSRKCKIPREPPAPRRRASLKPQRALGHSGLLAAASLKP